MMLNEELLANHTTINYINKDENELYNPKNSESVLFPTSKKHTLSWQRSSM